MNLLPKNNKKQEEIEKTADRRSKSESREYLPEEFSVPETRHIQPTDHHSSLHQNFHRDISMDELEKKDENVERSKKLGKVERIVDNSGKNQGMLFIILLSLSTVLLVGIFVVMVILIAQLRDAELFKNSNIKDVTVKSEPANANVYLDNVYEGITPLMIKNVDLSYARNLKVITSDGKYTQQQTISKDNYLGEFNFVFTVSSDLTDFDSTMNVPVNATVNKGTLTVKCREVKDYMTEGKKCANDGDDVQIPQYTISWGNADQGTAESIYIRPYRTTDICSPGNDASCPDGESVFSTSILSKDVKVYKLKDGSYIFIPNVKIGSKVYNDIYVKFSTQHEDRVESVLQFITSIKKNNA